MNRRGILFLIISALISVAFLFNASAEAAVERSPQVKVINSSSLGEVISFLAFDESFMGGGTVAVGDLGNDGIPEIVVGAGPGGGPQVRIFRTNGTVINSFFAYPADFRGGIRVAVGDVDGDGRNEIITGPGFRGGPQVRIFDGYGNVKHTNGFYAFHTDYRGGIHVAACDIDGNGEDEVVVGTGFDSQPHVRVFNRYGIYQNIDFRPFGNDQQGGVSVACANVDGGLEEEIVMGVNSYGESWVKTYKADADKIVVGSFFAFSGSFKGGVNIAGGDIDGDGYDEIVVAANSGGGPHVRTFEAHGKELPKGFFSYEQDFTGGVNIAVGNIAGFKNDQIITMPNKRSAEGRTDLPKYIEISLDTQTFKLFENGYKTAEYPVSSGRPGMDTPRGEFKILNKTKVAYSAPYQLWMPNWMSFTVAGHGLHGLPYWRLKGGGVYYEGEDHLGKKVSHGCVRLPVAGSEYVYNRVEVGTPIFIY